MRPKQGMTKIGLLIGCIGIFVTMTVYICLCIANPDFATIKSAVVWRQDNSGDYVFGEFAAPGVYETGYAHATKG